MKKRLFGGILIACLAALCMVMTACGEGCGKTGSGEFTVRFYNNNNYYATYTYDSTDTEFDLPVEPSKPGYEFVGWYLDDVLYDFSYTHGDVMVDAVYKVAEMSVTFVDGDSVVTDDFVYGTALTYDYEVPTKDGYVFGGWCTDEGKTTFYDMLKNITSDLTLYASWNEGSSGMVYTYTTGGSKASYFEVKSIGTASGDIVIPQYYNGLEVSVIAYGAFTSCGNITSITFGDSISEIGAYAFYNCKNLIDFYYNGDLTSWIETSVTLSSSPMASAQNFYLLNESGGYDKIKEIVIPSDVTKIGQYSFSDFSCLTSVVFHSGVESIGMYAFDNCTNLTSVTIPKTITTIGRYAFDDCSNLTIYCEADEALDGWSAIWYSGVYAINMGMTDKQVVEVDDAIYFLSDGEATLKSYVGKDNFYSVPSVITAYGSEYEVTSIGARAFYSTAADIICIPGSVISAESYITSSSQYVYLESETLPSGFNSSAFVNSNYVYYGYDTDNIAVDGDAIYLGDETTQTATLIKYIGDSESVEVLESIDISGTTFAVTAIGEYAFYDNDDLQEVTLASSVTKVADFAFLRCTNLKSIDLSNVTEICQNAFYYCKSLENIDLSSVVSIGTYAFSQCEILKSVDFGDGLNDIGSNSFRCCYALESVVTGDKVETIGSDAFLYCYALESVVTGDKVETIGSDAFGFCYALESVVIGKNVTRIESDAFRYCTSLAEIYNYSSLEITIGSIDNGYVGYYAACIYTDETAQSQVSTDENGFTTYVSGDDVVLYCYSGNESSPTIPDYVTVIGSFAFRENYTITAVTIPSGIRLIEKYAFYYCKNLSTITIEEGLNEIEQYAFGNCESLIAINLPLSVETVAAYSIYVCPNAVVSCAATSLPSGWAVNFATNSDSIVWGNATYTTINDTLFCLYEDGTAELLEYSGSSSKVEIEPVITYGGKTYTVDTIGTDAFTSNKQIMSIVIPSTITTIETSAFYGCSKLYEVYNLSSLNITMSNTSSYGYLGAYADVIHKSIDVESILETDDNGFVTCTLDGETILASYEGAATDIVIPSNVTTIGGYAFYGNTSITSLKFTNAIDSIGSHAFGECTSLSSVDFNECVSSIGLYSFSDCTSLTYINLDAAVNIVINNAFDNCTALSQLEIGENVSSIGSNAFSGCTALEFVYMPSNVESVGYDAFNGPLVIYCQAEIIPDGFDTSWYFNSVSSISTSQVTAYWGVEKADIAVVDGVTYLISGENATITSCGCASEKLDGDAAEFVVAETITVGGEEYSVTAIGEYAFMYSDIHCINIPSSIESVGAYAFYGCYYNDFVVCVERIDALTAWDSRWSSYSALSSSLYNGEIYYSTDESQYICIDSAVYEVTGGSATLIKYIGSASSFVVPDEVAVRGQNYAVTSIGIYAFDDNLDLQCITIGANITSIYSFAFSGCYNLKEIYNFSNIELKVGSYSDGYIAYYAVVIYTEQQESAVTIDENGFISMANGDEIVLLGYEGDATDIIIPENITSIGEEAFQNSRITSVVIGDNVTSIMDYAFNNCDYLEEITIGDNVTSIGYGVFQKCSKLNSITIPSSVTSMGDNLFYLCSSLELVRIEQESMATATNKGWIYNIILPMTIYWGEKDVVMFDGSTYSLLSNGTAVLVDYSGDSVDYDVAETITVGGDIYAVTCVGAYAFSDCDSVKNVTIDGNVTEVDCYAFMYCDSIETVVIGSKVTKVGENAFYDCSSFVSVKFEDSAASIHDYAFSGCDNLSDVDLGNNMTDVAQYAFSYCDSLKHIVVPASVNNVSSQAFYANDDMVILCEALKPGTNWESAWNYYNNTVCYGCNDIISVGNFTYAIAIDGTVMLIDYNGAETDLTLASTIEYGNITCEVTAIADSTFAYNGTIETITIPSSVETIGECAFYKSSIEEVIFQSDSKLETIEYRSFYGCDNLTSVVFGGEMALEYIYTEAFYGCDNLTNFNLPDSVKHIGTRAFANCASLMTLAIGAESDLQSVYNMAFSGSGLYTDDLPNEILYLAEDAFYGCNAPRG